MSKQFADWLRKNSTVRVRRAIYLARYEASQFGNRSLDPHHLLLGLLKEDRDLAWHLAPALAEAETIRKRLESQFKTAEKIPTSVELPLSPQSHQVLARAANEAEQTGHDRIGTGHLLLGLLGDEASATAKLLREFGASAEKLREQVRSLPEGRQSLLQKLLHLVLPS